MSPLTTETLESREGMLIIPLAAIRRVPTSPGVQNWTLNWSFMGDFGVKLADRPGMLRVEEG